MKYLTKTNLINLLGVVIIIYLSVALVQTVGRNNQLRRQVIGLQKDIDRLNSQNQELTYKILYYRTPEFQDKEARAKLGLQQAGESVIILPRTSSTAAQSSKRPVVKKTNLQQWREFLFG